MDDTRRLILEPWSNRGDSAWPVEEGPAPPARLLIAVVIILSVGACDRTPTSTIRTKLTCSDFERLVVKAPSNLAPDEIRARLDRIQADSKGATPHVQAAAEDMVSSNLAGPEGDLGGAETNMIAVCFEAGALK